MCCHTHCGYWVSAYLQESQFSCILGLIGTAAVGIPNGNYWMTDPDASNCAEKYLCYEVVNNTVVNVVFDTLVISGNDSAHKCSVLCQSNQDIYG